MNATEKKHAALVILQSFTGQADYVRRGDPKPINKTLGYRLSKPGTNHLPHPDTENRTACGINFVATRKLEPVLQDATHSDCQDCLWDRDVKRPRETLVTTLAATATEKPAEVAQAVRFIIANRSLVGQFLRLDNGHHLV